MENKNWIFGLVVFIIIAGYAAWGFSKNKASADVLKPVAASTDSGETIPTADNLIKSDEPYFSADAKVMEFYQPSCGWCIKESPILVDLSKQGYRVKPMNPAADQSLWQKYNVSGTPTFLAANGDRLNGYVPEDQLKTFLDNHK